MRSTQSIKEAKASSLRTHRVPFSADQRLLVLQKLQGKTDPATLLETLVNEIQKHIDINELTWTFEHITHTVARRQRASVNQTFSIKFGSNCLGTLRYQTAYPLDHDEITVIHTFHKMLAGPLNSVVEIIRLQQMAFYDRLTGLKNRYSFDVQLDKAIMRANSNEEGLSSLSLIWITSKALTINTDTWKATRYCAAMPDCWKLPLTV
ncbi:GGDEF domain-containing protein [Veronia nyctiphanis]|uniref:GGDEF domain-containing protein n=1 Tax=Veronia nyctiphanis TaxID=1278244 RepID=UPI00100B1027|nr:GGDEF domain-containing protein [Veronia nyctiphanis]